MRRILIILLMLCLSLSLLTACGDPAEVLTEGDFEVRIYTDADGVAKTVKTYRGGKLIDTWRPRGQVSYAEAPIRFVDVNFDGYTDMRILSATGDHLRYANRIYSPDTDSFYTSTVLDLLKDPVYRQKLAYAEAAGILDWRKIPLPEIVLEKTEAERAVEWITGAGIMLGNTSGDLMLGQPLTRKQFAVMLWRYEQARGK